MVTIEGAVFNQVNMVTNNFIMIKYGYLIVGINMKIRNMAFIFIASKFMCVHNTLYNYIHTYVHRFA